MEMRSAHVIQASTKKRFAVAVDTCEKKRMNTICIRCKPAASKADLKSVLDVGFFIEIDAPATKNASPLYDAPLREVREVQFLL